MASAHPTSWTQGREASLILASFRNKPPRTEPVRMIGLGSIETEPMFVGSLVERLGVLRSEWINATAGCDWKGTVSQEDGNRWFAIDMMQTTVEAAIREAVYGHVPANDDTFDDTSPVSELLCPLGMERTTTGARMWL